MLVVVGVVVFVDLGMCIVGFIEVVWVIFYVVFGVGFFGVGVIMKEGMNVCGFNIVVMLWCLVVIGCCIGVDMFVEGVLLIVLVIVGNILLCLFVNVINCILINEVVLEVMYEVWLSVDLIVMLVVCECLVELLEVV